MRHRIAAVAVGLLVVGLVPAAARGDDLPIPQEWSTYSAWFLLADPDHRPGSQGDESVLTAAHIQYHLRLRADGRSIAAGGLGDGAGDSIVGLTILRSHSLAEAQAIAAADPVVQAGHLTARVREWWVQAWRLP